MPRVRTDSRKKELQHKYGDDFWALDKLRVRELERLHQEEPNRLYTRQQLAETLNLRESSISRLATGNRAEKWLESTPNPNITGRRSPRMLYRVLAEPIHPVLRAQEEVSESPNPNQTELFTLESLESEVTSMREEMAVLKQSNAELKQQLKVMREELKVFVDVVRDGIRELAP